MTPIEEQVIETWQIHNRVNMYLLDAIDPASLSLALKEKGRTIGQLFTHIHNVRLMWLKPAAPHLLEGLEKASDTSTKAQLGTALKRSGDAIESLLRTAIEQGGKVKSFKRGLVPFLGYLISHESHHRGQIGWILKHSGHPLDKSAAFGMWDWNAR